MHQNEIKHYGVKGMKWGVIRSKEGRSDARQSRKLKRHVAASKKHLKETGRSYVDDDLAYKESANTYKKVLSKPSFNKTKKRELIEEASREMTESGARLLKSRAEFNRAKRIYNNAADEFKKHTDDMLKKYGSENVRQLSTKTLKLGKGYTEEVLKTSLTLSEIPIIGTMYNGRYIGQKEYEDRMQNIDREADKRY